ncbi:MAG: hypothetical protein ACREXO_20660 [Advenella sp.]
MSLTTHHIVLRRCLEQVLPLAIRVSGLVCCPTLAAHQATELLSVCLVSVAARKRDMSDMIKSDTTTARPKLATQ